LLGSLTPAREKNDDDGGGDGQFDRNRQ